jgi:TPR repeat protein
MDEGVGQTSNLSGIAASLSARCESVTTLPSLELKFFVTLNRILCGDAALWNNLTQAATIDRCSLAQAIVAVCSSEAGNLLTKSMAPVASSLARLSKKELLGHANFKQCKVAQCLLGMLAFHKLDAATTEGRMIEFFQQAADQSSHVAQYYLGRCYEGKDDTKAAHWYKIASDGFVAAQHRLGFCYEVGLGVDLNTETACYWFEQAMSKGYPEAQVALGAQYILRGSQSFSDEAEKLFTLAAAKNGLGWHYLGRLHQQGAGVPKNEEKAVEFYKLSAETGCGLGCYELARYHISQYNFKKAVSLLGASVAAGVPGASVALAKLYLLGQGVQKNAEKAKGLIEASVAVMRTADDYYALAEFYDLYECRQIAPDNDARIRFLTLAAERGSIGAKIALGRHLLRNTAEGVDSARGLQLLREASLEDITGRASQQLATLYLYGDGVPADINEAVRIFADAAARGNHDSAKVVRRMLKAAFRYDLDSGEEDNDY